MFSFSSRFSREHCWNATDPRENFSLSWCPCMTRIHTADNPPYDPHGPESLPYPVPHSIVALDAIDNLSIEHEKATIDPAFSLFRLFVKFHDLIFIEDDLAEWRWRTHRGDNAKFS